MKRIEMSIIEIKDTIEHLAPLFDIVRLVDPEETAIVTITRDNELVKEKYSCFGVWNKNSRCDNCTSVLACIRQQELTKYEVMNDFTFYVISKPICIIDFYGHKENLVLEIVNKVSDDELSRSIGIHDVREMIGLSFDKAYIDPLTEVYNRRYFDEYVYLYKQHNSVPKKISFLLVDIIGFKKINKEYGRNVGNEVLKQLGQELKNSVRSKDSVIRLENDEFMIILTNCGRDDTVDKASHLKEKLSSIDFGKVGKLKFAWGVSYTNRFITNDKYVDKMLDEAYKSMKLSKKEQKKA